MVKFNEFQEQQKAILNSISSTLSASTDLKETITKTFDVLDNYLGLKRATLTLIDPELKEVTIQMAHGLSKEEIKKGKYQIGEGIIGQVIESGEPIIIHKLKTDKRFLNKTGARKNLENLSFLCVPIKINQQTIGTLSVDGEYKEEEHLKDDFKLLSFIGLLIAQSIRFHELIEKEKIALQSENQKLKYELKEKYQINNMIGNSSAMQKVYEAIVQVANANATVLIRGESGTGKELVANAIHYGSPRTSKPFIKVNCGAIPESLIESELFGYEKGAFTDAGQTKIGKFEAANGGTIFLDEIAELSPALQVKLLRVLQEKEFERIGSTKPIKINLRVIAATNKNLEIELKEKRFREDLYYRLNVFPIFLPPLRERKSDIILLAEHFLEIYAKENNKKIKRISTLAIDLLVSYHWPGNVRELQNCIERATLVCNSDTIQATHLPPSLQRIDMHEHSTFDNLSLKEMISNFEREIIIDALKKNRSNVVKAAKMLQTTERILNYKIQTLKIEKPQKYKI
jgi:Nif-specific regulatory protein